VRALRILTTVATAFTVAVPAASAADHQLWYRVQTSVSGTYEMTWQNGDKQVQENAWTLRSNTAVLLTRSCLIVGSPLSATQIAIAAGIPPNSSCAELRSALRGQHRQFLSRLREDFSFAANATGSAASWQATTTQAARTVVQNGKTAQCPSGSEKRRLTAPIQTVGRIGGSARSGILMGFDTRDGKWAAGTFTRDFEDCKDPVTGEVVLGGAHTSQDVLLSPAVLAGAYAPVHGGGSSGGEFGGALQLQPVKVANAERLFGKSFTLSGTQPGTHQFAANSGSSKKNVRYEIRFSLCPGGGRDVKHC
jgi:hypothetical protein